MERSDFFKQIAQRLAWVAAKRDPRRLRLELLKKIDRIAAEGEAQEAKKSKKRERCK